MAEAPRYDAALVAALVRGQLEGPAGRWLASGEGTLAQFDPVTAVSLVEAAVRTGRYERLAAAQDEATDKRVRKAVGAAVHKARAAGHTVERARSGQRWTLDAEERQAPPPQARVGFPDVDGYVEFVFVAHRADEAVVIFGDAGPGQGYRTAEVHQVPRSVARDLLADLARDGALVEVPPHEALHFLERAFSAAGRHPRGWDHLLLALDEGLRNSARLLDPLAAFPAQVNVDFVADGSPFYPDAPDVGVRISEELLDETAAEILAAESSPLELEEASREARVDRAIARCARAVVEGTAREGWIFALEVYAWLLRRRDLQHQALQAWHAARALRAGTPGDEVALLLAAASEVALVAVEVERLERAARKKHREGGQ